MDTYYVTYIGKEIHPEARGKILAYRFTVFRVGDPTPQLKRIPPDSLEIFVNAFKTDKYGIFTNFEVSSDYASLELTGLNDISNYPVYCDGVIRKNKDVMIILGSIFNLPKYQEDLKKNEELPEDERLPESDVEPIIVGYAFCNPAGKFDFGDLSYIHTFAAQGKIVNAEWIQGEKLKVYGDYPSIPYVEEYTRKKLEEFEMVGGTLNSGLIIDASNLRSNMTLMELSSVDDIIKNVTRLSPLLANLLDRCNPTVTDRVETMAASEDSILIGKKMLDKDNSTVANSLEELTFILMHECYHVMYAHKLVFLDLYEKSGGTADHDIWNIAADIYINRQIMQIYGIDHPGGYNTEPQEAAGCMRAPIAGCYIDDYDVDQFDNPISIYERIMAETKNAELAGQGSLSLSELLEKINNEHNKQREQPQGGMGGLPMPQMPGLPQQTTEERVRALHHALVDLKNNVRVFANAGDISRDAEQKIYKEINAVSVGLNNVKREDCVNGIENLIKIFQSC